MRRLAALAARVPAPALVALVLSASALLPLAATAATWHVLPDGTGDAPTIQAAVDSSAAGDSILVAAGTYLENVVLEPGRLLIGSWDDSFAASDVHAHPTTVDGDSLGPCIQADFGHHQDADGLIAGLKLTNGAGVLLDNEQRWGGGVYAVGLWRIRDCIVEQNYAHHGAGLYVKADEPEISNLEARLNSLGYIGAIGDEYGGGLHLSIGVAATIDSSVFEENSADYCVYVHGSGIYAEGPSLTVRNTVVSRNGSACSWSGGVGLGICSVCDSLIVEDCTITHNKPEIFPGSVTHDPGWGAADRQCWPAYGAGIYATNARIVRSTIDNNDASDRNTGVGGGLYLGTGVISECSISNNVASGFDGYGSGGGIYASSLTITDCELIGNFAHGGLESGNSGGIRAGTLRIARTIVAFSDVFGNWNASGTGITAGEIDADQIVVFRNRALRNDRFKDTVGAVKADAGRVRNSIIADNSVQVTQNPVIIGGLSGAVSSEYNLFWNNTGEDHAGLTAEVGHVYEPPLFTDPAAGDFGLRLHSPAIDRGDPGVADPDGSRSDLGARGGPDALMDRPERVTGLTAAITEDGYVLAWDASGALDLAGYAIYRLPDAATHPSAETFVRRSLGTTFLDPIGPPWPRPMYRVSAFDGELHGGGYSEAAAPGGPGPVRETALFEPDLRRLGANPARGAVIFEVRVPASTPARLQVFDIRGRRVWTRSQPVPAGISELRWPALDELGQVVSSGIYFVQIDFAGESYRQKVVVVR